LSIATLGIQRFVASGEYVPWSRIPQFPVPIFSIWYQRTPAWSLPVSTEWLVTIVCQVPKFRYCTRCIRRFASVSSLTLVPGCGMQFPE
jgi:hypothetical protein